MKHRVAAMLILRLCDDPFRVIYISDCAYLCDMSFRHDKTCCNINLCQIQMDNKTGEIDLNESVVDAAIFT